MTIFFFIFLLAAANCGLADTYVLIECVVFTVLLYTLLLCVHLTKTDPPITLPMKFKTVILYVDPINRILTLNT